MKSFCFVLFASAFVATSLAATPDCGPHGKYLTCGSCNATCADPLPRCDRSSCQPAGCYCDYPWVWSGGECVFPTECPKLGECGANEQYFVAHCEATCEDPSPFCTSAQKTSGCQCKDGFVRSNGKCIRQSQCPAKPLTPIQCGPNAKYWECTTCNGTCAQPDLVCTKFCNDPGCLCNDGFVSHNDECIAANKCPAKHQCGANEEWKEFNEADCEGTCEDPNPFFCDRSFKPEGCYCKPGFVREDGKCIAPSQCPAKKEECGANAKFYPDCGTCNLTCAQTDQNCPKFCYSSGCYCLEGFFSHNGECIAKAQCPTNGENQCQTNEVYLDDGEGDCERTCAHPDVVPCVPHMFEAGCYCMPPFVRHNGRCIRRAQCPRKTPLPTQAPMQCGANAKFLTCGVCNGTCELPVPTCENKCQAPGCYCNRGFVSRDGECVLPTTCPNGKPSCGKNEDYEDCADCEKTCEHPVFVPNCPRMCQEGCRCVHPLVRHNGKCIQAKNCPKKTAFLW